jgi:cysteine desulfurase
MIYLDHNATTPLRPLAKKKILTFLDKVGNPASIHSHGRLARKYVEDCREAVGHFLSVPYDHITFTSGATETFNWVLKSQNNPILYSHLEHDAVIESIPPHLGHMIQVTPHGHIDLQDLEHHLKIYSKQNPLVCVMVVQNETGIIQPIGDVLKLTQTYGAKLLCDGVQGVGKIDDLLIPLIVDIDYFVFSSHKIGGPTGVGVLYQKNPMSLIPMITGGGQEKSLRSGTHHTLGICGLHGAIEDLKERPLSFLKNFQKDIDIALKDRVVGIESPRVSNTVCFTPWMDAPLFVMACDQRGCSISSGSACSSGRLKKSRVLKAMGVGHDQGIRVSMGWNTTPDDVQFFLKIVNECLMSL